jgi:hypothetical protein
MEQVPIIVSTQAQCVAIIIIILIYETSKPICVELSFIASEKSEIWAMCKTMLHHSQRRVSNLGYVYNYVSEVKKSW